MLELLGLGFITFGWWFKNTPALKFLNVVFTSSLQAMPASYRPNIVSLLSDRSSELAQPGRIVYHFEEVSTFYWYTFFIRKLWFCMSLNFLNFFRNWAWDFLNFFLSFTDINWLKWFTLSLLILYAGIWIPYLTFWMQWQRNIDFFWPIKTLNFGNWALWFD